METIQIFFNYQGSDYEGKVDPVMQDHELVHYKVTVTAFPLITLEAQISENEQLRWVDVTTGQHTDLTQAIGKAIEIAES